MTQTQNVIIIKIIRIR